MDILSTILGMEPGLTLAVVLFALALVLVMGEVFIPSGGALTILAVLAVGGSVFSAFHAGVWFGLGFIIALLVAVPAVMIVSFRIFPSTPIGRLMIARGTGDSAEARAAVDRDEKSLVGQTGVARSTLRPSGSADIAGDIRDVITGGELVEANTRVQVVEVRGNRIVVRAI